MKNDLVTAILIGIVGTLGAFFLCNIFSGDIGPAQVKTISGSFNSNVVDPNVEVFNYRAINPTVDVYVGGSDGPECEQYDSGGNCVNSNGENAPDVVPNEEND